MHSSHHLIPFIPRTFPVRLRRRHSALFVATGLALASALSAPAAVQLTGGSLLLGNSSSPAPDPALQTFGAGSPLPVAPETQALGSLILATPVNPVSDSPAITTQDSPRFGPSATTLPATQLVAPAADVSFSSAPGHTEVQFKSLNDLSVSAVPEPATIYGGLALVGLIAFRERRRLLRVRRTP